MTKPQVLTRYVLCAVLLAALTATLDYAFVALELGWIAWLLDVAFASGLIVVTLGTFAPNSPFFGRVVDGEGVGAPVCALTFDDGPSADTTPRILDTLARERARATFFVLGKHATAHPELIERIARDGHELASHGYSHGLLVFASRRRILRELTTTSAVVNRHGGPPMRLYRAPHGFRNPFVVPLCRRLGYRVVGWTKGVFDTALPGPDVIVERARRALRPGAILLLHDADGSGTGDRSQTAEALPAIVSAARAAGLELVTVSELDRLSPRRSTSWKRLALVVAGVAVVITVAFERADRAALHQAWVSFKTLSVPLVAAALVANLASVWFKAIVWKASLDTIPGHPRFSYRQVVPAIFIGFLLNSALVARLGEVGRIFVLRRRVQKDENISLPMTTIAGTVVMEQIVLGVTLVALLVGMTIALPSIPGKLKTGLLVLAAVVAALMVGAAAVEVYARGRRRRRPAQPPQEPAARSWRAFVTQVEAVIHGMSRGQRLLRHPGRAAWSAGGGLLSWVGQLIGIWLTLKAFGGIGTHHVFGAAAVVFLASNLIGLIQITPGNVGVFQGAVATALSATYGIDYTTGVTFGILLQGIEVALGAGLGLVFLSLEGLSFGEIRRGISGASAPDAAAPAPPALVPARTVAQGRLVV